MTTTRVDVEGAAVVCSLDDAGVAELLSTTCDDEDDLDELSAAA